MRILGIDLETTGLDLKRDRILKLGTVLYDVELKKVLMECERTLWHDTYPECHPEALKIHGIEKKECIEFGLDPTRVLEKLAFFIDEHKVEAVMAHNGNGYDFPMLIEMAEAYNPTYTNFYKNLAKIDTAVDLPYPERIMSRKLTHLAAEHGFLNPFPHSALSDIRTMFLLFSHYDPKEVIARSKSPTVEVRAQVHYDDRELAKKRRFQWDSETRSWIKKIKRCDLEKEIKEATFSVVLN